VLVEEGIRGLKEESSVLNYLQFPRYSPFGTVEAFLETFVLAAAQIADTASAVAYILLHTNQSHSLHY